jgi:hypothetical protein
MLGVMQVLDDNAMEAGLLPIFVDPETGRSTTTEIRLGATEIRPMVSFADSFQGKLAWN